MNIDLTKNNLEDTMKEYEPLLCEQCKVNLREATIPLMNRLNEGKQPRLKDMLIIVKSLCMNCAIKIQQKKRER